MKGRSRLLCNGLMVVGVVAWFLVLDGAMPSSVPSNLRANQLSLVDVYGTLLPIDGLPSETVHEVTLVLEAIPEARPVWRNASFTVAVSWGDGEVDLLPDKYGVGQLIVGARHMYSRRGTFDVDLLLECSDLGVVLNRIHLGVVTVGKQLVIPTYGNPIEGSITMMTLGRWSGSKDRTSVETLELHMGWHEAIKFLRRLHRTKTYLEFGSGGSTYLASSIPTVARIVTVENDPKFLELVADHPVVKAAAEDKRFVPCYVNTGTVGAWGRPKDRSEEAKAAWPAYPKAGHLHTGPFDTIFVDGRFRVATALESLSLLSESGLLIVHDYEREGYHAVEKYFDVLYNTGEFKSEDDRVGHLVVLKPKPGVTVDPSDIPYNKFQRR